MTSASSTVMQRPCWCGANQAHPAGTFQLDDGKNFNLVRCNGCGVFALFPQPSDEELLHYYSSEYYGSSRRKFIGPIAKLISYFQGGRARLASRHVRKGGRVLDIGCGNGGFLIRMKQRGFQVEGTEWTAESAARVPAEERIPVHVGDLLDIELLPHSFDLITLWHVFEHLRKPDEIVEKIGRLLKPGGALLLSLPNAESSQARRFKTHWLHHDPPRHLFGFGPQSIRKLLDRHRFEITSVGTFSLEQNPFGFVQSWLNSIGCPRDRLYSRLKGIGHSPMKGKLVDYLWLLFLAIPAAVITSVESMFGKGATMTIHARRPMHE